MTTRYDPPTTPPLRTIDRPDGLRDPTPEALAVLRAMASETDDDGTVVPADMAAPHLGPRFSQRKLARLILAGRSYQAVQAWLGGDPVPRVTADWLLEDLVRVDARQDARTIVLQDDEIAIVVRR